MHASIVCVFHPLSAFTPHSLYTVLCSLPRPQHGHDWVSLLENVVTRGCAGCRLRRFSPSPCRVLVCTLCCVLLTPVGPLIPHRNPLSSVHRLLEVLSRFRVVQVARSSHRRAPPVDLLSNSRCENRGERNWNCFQFLAVVHKKKVVWEIIMLYSVLIAAWNLSLKNEHSLKCTVKLREIQVTCWCFLCGVWFKLFMSHKCLVNFWKYFKTLCKQK